MPDPAAAVDASFIAAFRMLADVVEGGRSELVGDVAVTITGLPYPSFNAVFVTHPVGARVGDLAAALDLMAAAAVPYLLHLRADLDPATKRAVADRGLVSEGLLPGMAMAPGPAPAAPRELVVRRVTDPELLAAHRQAAAEGFGLPIGVIDRLMTPAMLAIPGLRPYLGTVDGQPVATALGLRTADVLGLYNIATVAPARGRGYGTAMTWAAIADAEPGVRQVVLQSSEMGRPIYERMGFRTVVEYEERRLRP